MATPASASASATPVTSLPLQQLLVSPRVARHTRRSGGGRSRHSPSCSSGSISSGSGEHDHAPATLAASNVTLPAANGATTRQPLGKLISTPRGGRGSQSSQSQSQNGSQSGRGSGRSSFSSPYSVSRKPSLVSAVGHGVLSPAPPSARASGGASSGSGSKRPSSIILNALVTAGKKSSLGKQNGGGTGSGTTPRSSLEKASATTPRSNALQRKASLVRVQSHGMRYPKDPQARERIGRNGKPLRRKGTPPTSLRQYIRATKGQFGLEPERPAERFDPLADDDSDNESATLSMPSPATGSMQSRERHGTRVISGALAAQRAGKKWRPNASDQEGGLVHIAAGIVLPPLAAASLPMPRPTRPSTPTKDSPTPATPADDSFMPHEEKTPGSTANSGSKSKAVVASSGTHPSISVAARALFVSNGGDAGSSPGSPRSGGPAFPAATGHNATPPVSADARGTLNPRRRRSVELEEEETERTAAAERAQAERAANHTPPSHHPLATHASMPSPSSAKNSPGPLSLRRKASGVGTPVGNVADPRDANRGRIERKPSSSSFSTNSPSSSPSIVPAPASSSPLTHALPSPHEDDGFQVSMADSLSADAVQERWRRNLMKRMSVNISHAPSPFSGILGGGAGGNSATQERSPGSGGPLVLKSGSFSKEASASGGLLHTEVVPRELGMSASRSNSIAGHVLASQSTTNSPLTATRRHSVTRVSSTDRRSSMRDDRDRTGHTRQSSQSRVMGLSSQRSSHFAPVPSLAAQQTNSTADVQPYPQNPNFSFLFPHQELLAQQREYYASCSRKLLEYLQWETDQDMDPVIVPASAHPQYHMHAKFRRVHRNSHTTGPFVPSSYPLPPTLPSSFDVNFWRCYTAIQDWDSFDIFEFSELTHGWPLSFMFVTVLKKLDLFAKLKLDPKVTFRFIQEVESHYLPNPYHQSIHSADVVHAVYHFLGDSALRDSLSALDTFLLFVACAVHDFAHPGVTNAFLSTTRAPLAIRYNDRSVLESFHVSSVFRMMQLTPGCNILEAYEHSGDTQVYTRARKLIIEMVLATDLAQHFDLLRVMKGKFEAIVTSATADANGANGVTQADTPLTITADAPSASIDDAAATTDPISPPSVISIPSPIAVPSVAPVITLKSDEEITLVLQMLLKLGDLSHPARPKNLHLRWAELVTEEFFTQGDRERSLNLTPSMFMDRHSTNVATSQLGFLTFLVLPLFQCAGKLLHNGAWERQVEKSLDLWSELEKVESREQAQTQEAERLATISGSDAGSKYNSLEPNALGQLSSQLSTPAAASSGTPSPPQILSPLGGAISSPRSPSINGHRHNGEMLPPGAHTSNVTLGPITPGRGICGDRTVLSMFQKVRELNDLQRDYDSDYHSTGTADDAPTAAALLDRQKSVPTATAEEPASSFNYTDASMPNTPATTAARTISPIP